MKSAPSSACFTITTRRAMRRSDSAYLEGVMIIHVFIRKVLQEGRGDLLPMLFRSPPPDQREPGGTGLRLAGSFAFEIVRAEEPALPRKAVPAPIIEDAGRTHVGLEFGGATEAGECRPHCTVMSGLGP